MMARAVLEERLGELESSQREQMSAVEVLWERFKVLKSRTSALFPRQRKERTAEERRAAEARAASHWIDLSEVLGHARGSNSGGRLTLSAAPAAKKVDGLCDMGADHIVTLLRSDETMCAKVKAACTKRGIGWTHLPLSGGRVDGEGDMETIAQLPAVVDLLRRGRSVVLHCAAGMHRTGVAAYITLRLAGCSPAAAKDAVLAMREVTHEELTKGRKRGGSLCDRAETLFSTTFQRENGVLKADPNQGTKQDGGEEGLTKFSRDPPTTIANHDAASVKAASLTPCAPPCGVSAEARRFMIESGGAEWETVPALLSAEEPPFTNGSVTWGIRDLQITANTYYLSVINVSVAVNGFKMQRVVVRANSFFCASKTNAVVNVTNPLRAHEVPWSLDVLFYPNDQRVPAAAVLAVNGRNWEVSDCNIYSSWAVLRQGLVGNLDPLELGGYGLFVRNIIHNGKGSALQSDGAKQWIIEGNTITGTLWRQAHHRFYTTFIGVGTPSLLTGDRTARS
eukprot:m.468354 g.468354  ORF g.468354 m.468354 type:complete len:509 (+) comp27404_c0_seq1:103-1629(+)